MSDKKENKIVIGAPKIFREDGVVRLQADTVWSFDGRKLENPLFFEVESEWGKYLTAELSDSFVLALLELALERSCDIYYEAPMSEDLKYRLEQYMIPILASQIKEYHYIGLYGATTRKTIESEMAVGTGFSGGVDSFYTVLSHKDIAYESKRVTHLLFALNGAAMSGMTEELDKKWFQEEMARFRSLAEEMGLSLIGVRSNVSLLNHYRKIQKGGDIVVTASFVHALRKLFGLYYWAADKKAGILGEDWADGRITASMSFAFLESAGLSIYPSGCEVNRMEKVEYIADNPVVQKGLTVCGQPDSCGFCAKCLRTMAELYSIGKLDLFGAVFDVEDYKKHFTTKLARELAIDSSIYIKEIMESMKGHGITIPITVYLKKNYFKLYYFLKKKLRNQKFFMKMYYLHGWDRRLGEGGHSKEVVEARMAGKGK